MGWHLVNEFDFFVFEEMGFKLGMGDLYPFFPPIRVENKNSSGLDQKLTNILNWLQDLTQNFNLKGLNTWAEVPH